MKLMNIVTNKKKLTKKIILLLIRALFGGCHYNL